MGTWVKDFAPDYTRDNVLGYFAHTSRAIAQFAMLCTTNVLIKRSRKFSSSMETIFMQEEATQIGYIGGLKCLRLSYFRWVKIKKVVS